MEISCGCWIFQDAGTLPFSLSSLCEGMWFVDSIAKLCAKLIIYVVSNIT